MAHPSGRPLDGLHQLFEGDPYAGLEGLLGGEFVVSATQVLDEGMPSSHRSSCAQLWAAHGSEPCLEPAVASCDLGIRILLRIVQRRRCLLVEYPRG
jgi:hypothetical protein